eukprot:gnl/MRDRNA2_/MRDRNA2_116298_c0_seq1.p1 gnl/MRDRNA2_/MRDRNA2_116298_c0~~gnl/MRDRNA2_/MRDRNA2_116298_c0_seq1.p1  ORF type:complete len:264 (-),score=38.89 gnl/MRDRNA2_/MRDRNA2_116298_c0_seq1:194-985(-)
MAMFNSSLNHFEPLLKGTSLPSVGCIGKFLSFRTLLTSLILTVLLGSLSSLHSGVGHHLVLDPTITMASTFQQHHSAFKRFQPQATAPTSFRWLTSAYSAWRHEPESLVTLLRETKFGGGGTLVIPRETYPERGKISGGRGSGVKTTPPDLKPRVRHTSKYKVMVFWYEPFDPSNPPLIAQDINERVPYTWAMHTIVENFQKKYMVTVLHKVVSLEEWKAKEVMEEAYTKGVAKVITCPLEHAEFFKASLLAKGLNSTIELEI